jgi:excisionase family DNA binding protein
VTFGDRFYSVAELAAVTGHHRDSINRAIESGALAASKPRGKWLIAGAAINDSLQAGTTPITEPRPRTAASTPAPRGARTTRRGGPDTRPSFREPARRRRSA